MALIEMVEMVEILKETHNCFVATNVNGGVRFGIKDVLITESDNPEVVSRAIEICKIVDEDEFEDEIIELWAIGHVRPAHLVKAADLLNS